MLDDDDRVIKVSQPLEGGEQPLVIPLVKPDTRLVKHIEHAGQTGADLRGQPDSLRFAG